MSTTPACQHNPDQWFDRRHRSKALAACLTCPIRSWCAQQALKWQASYGLWAGIWIDGSHRDARPHLHAIAAGDAVANNPPPTSDPTPQQRPAPRAPLHRPATTHRPRSTPAAVLARSFGHCEVFAAGCRYTFDHLISRCQPPIVTDTASPATCFAACAPCAEAVAGLEPQLAHRLGYALGTRPDPATVPFHWRGARWVLLGHNGWLTEMHQDVQTA